jgi:PAS domain S-box-containing protein
VGAPRESAERGAIRDGEVAVAGGRHGRRRLFYYGIAAASVAITYVIKPIVESWVGPGPPLLVFLPAVTIAAWVGGLGPGLFATAAAALVCTYYHLIPYGSFAIYVPNDQFRMVVFTLEGALISGLMELLHGARREAEASTRRSRRYQEASRRERDFAEGLIATAEALVLVLDRSGRIVRVNPFLERATGFRPDEVAGKDWFATFVPSRDQERAREAFLRVLAGSEGSQMAYPIVSRDGREREFKWAQRALEGTDGAACVLGIGIDITKLKAAQQRALQAERLAAIGEMMAGLAHESRNALHRAQVCLEMLALEVEDRPAALNLIDRLQKAQDDLYHLFEDVRSYAAPIRLDLRACDLADVWRETWANLEPHRRGRDAALREQTDGLDLQCVADPFRLEQVFRNILDNALAACPDPVMIEVRCAGAELDGRPAVRVTVRDHGPGLSPEQRQRLFEPFFTTKPRGTGLGMPIARRIVEAHGGTIALGEGGGPGAEIVLTLPRGRP